MGAPCGKPGEGGACDGKGACVYCAPGDLKCDGATPSACDAKGQWQPQPACAGGAPKCSMGACVACLVNLVEILDELCAMAVSV